MIWEGSINGEKITLSHEHRPPLTIYSFDFSQLPDEFLRIDQEIVDAINDEFNYYD